MGESPSSLHIGVIGGSDASDQELTDARIVGRLLAEAGAVLVCGGLDGVMKSACEGAHEAHGTTVGLLPGTDRGQGNDYLDVVLPTGLGELRNGLIVRSSQALIAIGGAWGTLSEISFAMRTDRPVVVLGAWQPGFGISPSRHGAPMSAADPSECVRLALELARRV